MSGIDRSLAQFMRHQRQRVALRLGSPQQKSIGSPRQKPTAALGVIVLTHRTAQGTKRYEDVELPKDQTRDRL